MPHRSGVSSVRVLHAAQDWWTLLGMDILPHKNPKIAHLRYAIVNTMNWVHTHTADS
jgi:hypothetical protein